MRFSTIAKSVFSLSIAVASVSVLAAGDELQLVDDGVIEAQRKALAGATEDAGFGPQSPRDIDSREGANQRTVLAATDYARMNLCNIHFHEGAEHKGGEFTSYAGNGDGKGYGSGYLYDGELTDAELAPIDYEVGLTEHGDLQPGDTIEIHYVHTNASVEPGPSLNSCLSEAIFNPQLRVEAQVYVLVNDDTAADFMELTALEVVDGRHQAVNIPTDMGTPVKYAGSTTGPGYNEKGSPIQVSWSVHPKVKKVNIETVATWLKENPFDEDHAHGVRNLVVNPDLLSVIPTN